MSFDPGANSILYSLAVQGDGKILAGGSFTFLGGGGTGTNTRSCIGRLYPDGSLDTDFNPFPSVIILTLALQADGKILTEIGSGGIGRRNPDGTLDTSFNSGGNGVVYGLAVQADGKILVGGNFTTLGGGGGTRNNIGRLNSNGTLDIGFDPGANDEVYAVATQPDGKILIAGSFTTLGGGGTGTTPRNRIGRLNPDGTLDTDFNPGANLYISSLAIQADGKILVGGGFTGLGGGTGATTRNRIGRLNPDGTLDPSFNPGANDLVYTLAVQGDGKILAGGFFTAFGGGARNHIGRVNSDGTLDTGFNPGANDTVYALAIQADGQILAGGSFTTLGGGGTGTTTRNRIGRLNPNGTLDASFDPNASDFVLALALQADGKILTGGTFSTLGGTPRNSIGRLTNYAALQSLTVPTNGTTINWSRSGASPEVDRVTFELSTDAINYTTLAPPTRVAGGWQLTGQSLPTQQNIFIRARGLYTTGGFVGSGSIVETVRTAFISAPTAINISGTISYCSNPVPGPVPNVTLNLTGTASGSTLSDGSGNYIFSSLAAGGSYTVTPTKAALPAGTGNITSVDAVAVQRHFLNLGTPLAGCRLAAADVTGNSVVDGIDAIAVQRFFLGLPTGIANTGNYQFSPASRSYSGIVSNQTGQNYDTLIFGDVASPFTNRAGGPSQDAAGDAGTSVDEVLPTVVVLSLPNVAVDAFATNFIVQVTTTTIDAKNRLVGFQGDFIFDERVVTFESQPAQKAGITAGNWNVLGNVLPGPGPMRTLRISAYSNDFTPLFGSGTLFELRMTRVSKAGQGTQLIWAAPPDQFVFIDADLETQMPGSAASGSVLIEKRK